MPQVYASLIRKGLKIIEQVPLVIRDEVQALLADNA
ncbi:CD1375 family protein [Paenibacillus sp. FSL R10-2736]